MEQVWIWVYFGTRHGLQSESLMEGIVHNDTMYEYALRINFVLFRQNLQMKCLLTRMTLWFHAQKTMWNRWLIDFACMANYLKLKSPFVLLAPRPCPFSQILTSSKNAYCHHNSLLLVSAMMTLCIVLRRKQLLTWRWDIISRNPKKCWIALSVIYLPPNHTSSNQHYISNCSKFLKITFCWEPIKIFQWNVEFIKHPVTKQNDMLALLRLCKWQVLW